ncbi:MAG: CRTAC1 family protein, partial [Planctomycetales bacterium]|nr:CRTAC1 family protein [Planctomycetales bacterium]
PLTADVPPEPMDHGILRLPMTAETVAWDSQDWTAFISLVKQKGFQLLETEWHHSTFRQTPTGAASDVSFVLHLIRPLTVDAQPDSPEQRLLVRGILSVEWQADADEPTIRSATAKDVQILARTGKPAFRHVLTYRREADEFASAHPILVYDLDRNGFPDIVIPRWNRIYWNQGQGHFRQEKLVANFIPLAEAGLLADINSDGAVDLVTVDKQGRPLAYAGNAQGKFTESATAIADISVPDTLAITAGDIDADGDVDLWLTQYKPSYVEGQMPTPYYDANDGQPAYLLVNQGDLKFHDRTEQAGLSTKRQRRTYSSSLVDVDADADLDLVVTSDYAGVDLYENDGFGNFRDTTDQQLPERHLFGMAHTFADFDVDGQLDIYAIGMSSTTARRLDRLGLGRSDKPDVHRMRSAMGYGNRMYLRRTDQFEETGFAAQVARTGWSWGTTSFDFDADGDRDIYVANGFRSGQSCQDYCTTYWRHDIYTGSSQPDLTLKNFFAESMADLNANAISWNGYEHNALLMNRADQGFLNVGFLLGVAFEYDSRAVVGADLDMDGRPDLIVAQYEFIGQGFELSLHVYQNQLSTTNNWIGINLDRPNKPSPLGAKVMLETDEQTTVGTYVAGDSFLSQHPPVLHFGLGTQTPQKITIQWPDGSQEILEPSVNQYQ